MIPKYPILVSLSGGMDSATVLAYAVQQYGKENTWVSMLDYGQSHKRELLAAAELCDYFKINPAQTRIHHLNLRDFTEGAILNPRGVNDNSYSHSPDSVIAPSWVPARNAIILSLLAGYAYCNKINTIATGVNAIDWSGYPDCTPEFISALERALEYGLKSPDFEIWAPLSNMTKKDIVLLGTKLGVPWHLTWSCYAGGQKPCGTCGACVVRAKGFEEAGIIDPTIEVKA